MKSTALRRAAICGAAAAVATCWMNQQPACAATTIRVAAYNLQADSTGSSDGTPTQYAILAKAIEDVGTESVGSEGAVQLDIIGLEETADNINTTGTDLVADLNSHYGGTAYVAANSGTEYDDNQTNGAPLTDGNGPNSLIYNQNVLTLVGAAGVGVGNPSGPSDGVYRQVMRYEFEPVGGTSAQAFYVYVEHAKSGEGSTSSSGNSAYRAEEATVVTNNIATLPAGSSYIVMGDMNIDGTNESVPSGKTSLYQQYVQAGMVDPLNPSDATQTYGNGSTVSDTLFTESIDNSREFEYRDDYQFDSSNTYNGTSAALDYVSGSEHAFGNNGSVADEGTYSTQSTSPYASDLYGNDEGSDHLPIVADYNIAGVPEPASLAALAMGAGLLLRRRFN